MASRYIDGSAARKIEYNVYSTNKILKEKRKSKLNKTVKLKAVIMLLIVFAAAFVIMARYASILDLNYKISKLEREYNALVSENSRLEIKLEKMTDLDEIRLIAQEKLNMVTPIKSQKVYVKIPKNDCTIVSDEYKNNVRNPDSDNTFAILLDKVDNIIKLLY